MADFKFNIGDTVSIAGSSLPARIVARWVGETVAHPDSTIHYELRGLDGRSLWVCESEITDALPAETASTD
ncbi:MAG: hypothetical protein JO053_14440 [Acidobacteria bacterium]|nr:hypothetical protein [Acidobacteriota bacterium]